jgi:transmembrane sensor
MRMRTHWSGRSVTFQTGVGDLKNIRLSDGSSVALGGNTKLAVTLSTRARSVELFRGEAWFRVAHDAKWPFVVHAGGGAIRAVGTAFLVTRDSDRVVVAVTEGIVAITPARATRILAALSREKSSSIPGRPIRVSSGQQLSYHDNGTVASLAPVDAHAATAWTHGRLVFDDEPLRYVIESLNRYFPQSITATLSIGGLRFSGVVFAGEIPDWLHGLPQIFPVDIEDCGRNICILMDAPGERPTRRRDSPSPKPFR